VRAGEFIKENLNAAEQFAKYVTPGEVSSVGRNRARKAARLMRDGLEEACRLQGRIWCGP